MGSGFLNVRFSAAAKDIFVPWLNFCCAIMCLTSGWHSENFRGKMCNGQSINCLLGKFSPSRMIKSRFWKGTGRHLRAVHQLSLLFISRNWNGKLSAWLGLKTQEVHIVPLPPTLADPLQACDKLLISLQFFTPVLSLFCCALVWLLHIPSPSSL